MGIHVTYSVHRSPRSPRRRIISLSVLPVYTSISLWLSYRHTGNIPQTGT